MMNLPKPCKAASRAWTGIAAAALATIVIAAGASGAQAAGNTWTVVPSPNVTLPGGNIQSVSCSAPKACTAVGTNLDASGINVTLAERWDGTSWQRQATPNPASDTGPPVAPDLLGVSCPTARFCAAVGQYSDNFGIQFTMADMWDGSSWTLQSVPVPANSFGAALTAVSCTSPSFCDAVGTYFDSNAGTNATLAATWNGTAWSLQQTPSPGGFNFEQFNTVSCASPVFCEAWASGNAGNPGITLAEQWNGSSWQLQNVPPDATVNSVSCTSPRFCEAVGSGPAYTWNGSVWTAQTIPNPAGAGALGGVSCLSPVFCEAVGEYNNGDVVGVAAVWDGSAWSVQAAPNPAGGTFTNLNAVSCVSPVSCEAGGYFEVQVTSNDPQALAEAWTGHAWELQSAVAPASATFNGLAGVSCVSSSFCEAVGTQVDSAGNEVSLMENWNGQSWVIQPSPPGALSPPTAVSCASAQFCEAVGAGPSADVWDGTSWQVQARPGASFVSPQVVSCATADFCMSANGFDQIDIWNGSSWSAGPAVPGFSGVVSISCVSASFCEVTGGGSAGEGAAAWNGTSWTGQTTPAGIGAVTCTSASSCEGVGETLGPGFELIPSAASWNGSVWASQPITNPSTQGSQLTSVSCTSPNSCTAVGWYQSTDDSTFGLLETLVEVWDGTTWSLRPTPNPSATGNNLLEGVSCTSLACTAVGQAPDAGGVEATLIETGD